jgi:enoyl-CoA hydratase/carnithine racemase
MRCDGVTCANRTVKALVNGALDADLASGLRMEVDPVASHMRSAEAAEGLAAFADNRQPVFRPSRG